MHKTKDRKVDFPLYVRAEKLAGMLDVGLPRATQIGKESGARIQYGRTVLYSVQKVEEYLNKYLDGNCEERA
ncbi:MAG: hypothetical protein Q4B86_03930 [Eubacteriales bacterium]|nr:hypothetical protein [Eubacteriales bacterium]